VYSGSSGRGTAADRKKEMRMQGGGKSGIHDLNEETRFRHWDREGSEIRSERIVPMLPQT
jgi:hypothetical protein